MKRGTPPSVPSKVPLRVDFAGGWLDVPKLARPGAFIVNCAIQPLVSLQNWPYEIGAGLGGSAAHALLEGRDPVASELDLGVGWQDPAVIRETGLCVWRSGPKPALEMKADPDMLKGRMALLWTGKTHNTPALVDRERDLDLVEKAGAIAAKAVRDGSLEGLCEAVRVSWEMQKKEGMTDLPEHGEQARKYCGGGFGGYAVYLFFSKLDRDGFAECVARTRRIESYRSAEWGYSMVMGHRG